MCLGCLSEAQYHFLGESLRSSLEPCHIHSLPSKTLYKCVLGWSEAGKGYLENRDYVSFISVNLLPSPGFGSAVPKKSSLNDHIVKGILNDYELV